MLFDNKFFLKLYRKIEDGVNPDVEITRFLTEHTKFPNVPAFVGAIEYRRSKTEPTVVCLLQSAVANEGDGWSLTLDAVGRYYERVLARKADLQNEIAPPGALLDELFGGVYPEKMKLLGQRTGELHLALASYSDDPAFRAGTVQRDGATLSLPKHAGVAATRVYSFGKEIMRPSGDLPRRGEGSASR